MQVAIYARVSSEQQVEKSGLDVQIRECTSYASEMDHDVVEVYKDEGISGAHRANHREGLDRMLEGAKSGRFRVLLVHELDRLARELTVGLSILSAVSDYGIQVVEVSTRTPFVDTGALTGLVKLWAAGEDRKKILTRTKRGQIERAKKGLMSGPPPLGYDKDKEGRLVVNESEAALVRRIYDLYLHAEHHLDSLATLLNNEGVQTKRSRLNEAGHNRFRGANKWQRSTVQCVLRNPVYKGEYVYGKTRGRVPVGQDYQGQERRPMTKAYLETALKNRSFLPHEVVTVPVEPIVDAETWEHVQAKLDERYRRMRNRQAQTTHTYLFSGIVRCDHCGRLMTRMTMGQPKRKDGTQKFVSYYTCRNQENACPNVHRHHRMDAIDTEIMIRLVPYLRDPELIRMGLSDSLAQKESDQSQLKGRAAAIEKRLVAIGDELARIREAYVQKAFTLEEFKQEREGRDAEIEKLQRELAGIRAAMTEMAYEDELSKVEQVIAALSRLGRYLPFDLRLLNTYMDEFSEMKAIREQLPLELLPDDESKESFLLLVQTLVKRVRVNREGSVVDYALRIPASLPEAFTVDGDPENYKANLKCMTSPSLTS